MNRIVKFVVLPLAGLVVIVVAVVAYVSATFDPNQYKPQIVQAVKDKTQRTLKLEGDIKLSFFPDIGATLGKSSLSERASDKEFAGADDFHVALKLVPLLLSRQVVVDAIEATNLRANLIRFKDGKTNIDDLTGSADKSAPPATAGEPQLKVEIHHVTIKNAALTYTDHAAGAKYALSKLNLKTGRIASGVPSKTELSGTVHSDKPGLNLETALKTTVTFDPDKQIYVLDALDLTASGRAAGISNLVASAKGNVEAKLASREFIVSKLALAATGKQEGGDLNVKFDVPRLNVTRDKVSGEKIVLDATLNEGKNRIVVRLDIPGVDGTAQAFKANEFTANLDLQQDAATIKAKVTGPLAGSVDTERIELSKLVATVKVSHPKLPRNPIDATLNGSALVDLARQNASLNFTTKLDDSNINGKVGLARFTPPAYIFDINIDQLDADRYLPKSDPKQKQPEQPFDLSALKGLNANGSLRIGTLKLANVKASNVRVDVKAANGRVDVSPIAANLYQGSLSGALSVQAAATPVVTVRQNLNGVNVGPLLKDAADFDTLEGKGNITLDVSGQGNTVSAIRKTLNGNAAIKLTEGAIRGIDIAGTIRSAKSRLGSLKGEKTQAASKTEKTDFSELSGTFNIKNGIARNNDLSGKSPLLRLGGEGDIDIGNESLNYLVKATVVATAAGQGGRELSDLKGVTIPVRLSGPLTAPEYKIDFSGIAAGAAKALVETRTEEIKAKAQDQIKDRLKGLFGR